jgi:DNA-binding MarR family transcriptional regulator
VSAETDGWSFVVAVIHLYRDLMRVTEHQTGMSQTRLQLMHELYHDEELSQAELLQRLGVEGAVVTRIVKQLEAQGFVTRRADPKDNRYTLVSMTPAARLIQTQTEAMHFKDTFGARLMQGLDEAERAHLLQILKHIQENVEAVDPANL